MVFELIDRSGDSLLQNLPLSYSQSSALLFTGPKLATKGGEGKAEACSIKRKTFDDIPYLLLKLHTVTLRDFRDTQPLLD